MAGMPIRRARRLAALKALEEQNSPDKQIAPDQPEVVAPPVTPVPEVADPTPIVVEARPRRGRPMGSKNRARHVEVPEASQAAAPAVAGEGLRDGLDLLSDDEKFNELLGLSFARAHDIMETKPKADDKNYARIISTQQSVIASIFSMASKIDVERLRKGKTNEFEDILAAIKREQEKQQAPN